MRGTKGTYSLNLKTCTPLANKTCARKEKTNRPKELPSTETVHKIPDFR